MIYSTQWALYDSIDIDRESFHVKRSSLVEVRARTDPDLPSLVIFYVSIEISKILDHEANWRRCPHGPVTASHGMTQTQYLVVMNPLLGTLSNSYWGYLLMLMSAHHIFS